MVRVETFVRLDDLQQGYAFAQVDQATSSSPHKSTRAVMRLPPWMRFSMAAVDYILYANNYEDVDESIPSSSSLPT